MLSVRESSARSSSLESDLLRASDRVIGSGTSVRKQAVATSRSGEQQDNNNSIGNRLVSLNCHRVGRRFDEIYPAFQSVRGGVDRFRAHWPPSQRPLRRAVLTDHIFDVPDHASRFDRKGTPDMTATSLLLALTLTVSVAAFGAERAKRTDPRRPVILLVHGRGLLSRDSAEFRRDALHALRDGVFRATGDSLLDDDDLRLVWYADLMDVRRGVRMSTSCEKNSDSTDTGISASFILRSLALAASELVDASASDSVRDDAHDVAGDLRFVGDPAVRCAAENRVADALERAHAEGRPVVLVAHSLGALVTWGYLAQRSASDARGMPEVQRLVTMGSPLGNGGLRELLLGDTAEVSLPRGVRSWVNAVNPDDAFAARLVPSDSVTGHARGLTGISDIVTGRTHEHAHDLRGYLRDSSTAAAVVGAWCEAATCCPLSLPGVAHATCIASSGLSRRSGRK